MRLLEDLEDDEVIFLADADFHEVIQNEARNMVSEAIDAYREVATSSDDDNARVKAADRIIALAGFEEKGKELPSGISPEVFAQALAGLGVLAGIAQSSSAQSAILRNVSPAKSDPRPQFAIPIDDSPMNRKVENPDQVLGERYEIIERKDFAQEN